MPFIRRTWSDADANEWTREDWIAILISPIVYALGMVGLAMACLAQWEGFAMLVVAIVLGALLHWIIDPKLKAVSEEYEKKQKGYLDDLEANARWRE